MTRLRLSAALAVLLAATACTDSPTAIQPPEDGPNLNYVTSVNVICPATVQVGQYSGCDVYAWRSNGSYTWETFSAWWYGSNYAVLDVYGFGSIYGNSTGYATVYANVGGVVGTDWVQVTAPPTPRVATSISVTPSSSSVAVGQGKLLTAKVLDQFGQQMTGYSFTWSSSSTSVATVASTGNVTGVSTGSATITAQAAGLSGSASVSVVPGFSVSIEGDQEVRPNQTCTWWADVSGGTAPYSYSWYVPGGSGSSVYEPSSWTGSSSASSFTIHVTVTDANSVSISQQRTIQTNSSLPYTECPL